MKLKDIGEFAWIDRVRRGCLVRKDAVLKGIGDDAAVFHVPPHRATLVTTDLLVERVHFLKKATSAFNLGYKALAVNLSDIAAMGGEPREAFISIAIPEDCTLDYLDGLYAGMKHLAARHRVNILGGDTTASKTDLILNIMVLGTMPAEEILFRHTAQIGDVIFSTGFLGDSRAGLHLILEDIPPDTPALEKLLNAHLKPRPHVEEGRFLATLGAVHAAIDVSDGLSSDLGHILRSSNVGALLDATKIPVSPALKSFCARFSGDPLDYALSGGEDYVLLMTVPPEAEKRVLAAFEKTFHRPLFAIGRITPSKKLEITDASGRILPVFPSGWDHFKPDTSGFLPPDQGGPV